MSTRFLSTHDFFYKSREGDSSPIFIPAPESEKILAQKSIRLNKYSLLKKNVNGEKKKIMRDFIGLEQYMDEEYSRRIDHRFHSKGCRVSPKLQAAEKEAREFARLYGGRQPWASLADLCWVVCLHKCGAIDRKRAARLIKALRSVWDSTHGVSGEERILEAVSGDMDLASTVNYGRTLQEPMFRLRLRDAMIDINRDIIDLLNLLHKTAEENLETVMVGQTHMNHGQPMTYAHFLVSVFDGIHRGLEQFEQAYQFTNRNSGGCGSCSGTTWPVDRKLMAELLGMNDVMEPTFDCEASQDHTLAILFALANIGVHISRVSMNHYIWAIDEIEMLRTQPSLCGVSSFMPQKCDSGSIYEKVRMAAGDLIGETNKLMVVLKGEPHMDVLPAMQGPSYGATGMSCGKRCIRMFTYALEHAVIQKDRMLEIVREGYSCATELATYLVKEAGYGGRLAHSITATMVRQARARGLKAYECTGEMLDEAAEWLGQPEPGLDTATVRKCLDPMEFIKSHDQIGGTAPKENARLLEERRRTLDNAVRRLEERSSLIKKGLARLDSEADKIQAAN